MDSDTKGPTSSEHIHTCTHTHTNAYTATIYCRIVKHIYHAHLEQARGAWGSNSSQLLWPLTVAVPIWYKYKAWQGPP